jgi:hypothetical protein
MNWTGLGIAFPREDWPKIKQRSEFSRTGVYILVRISPGAPNVINNLRQFHSLAPSCQFPLGRTAGRT